MEFAKIIKNTRQRVFLSQEEFATIIGTSVSTINRWENGKCKPSLKTMKVIKDFCKKNKVDYTKLESAWLEDDTL